MQDVMVILQELQRLFERRMDCRVLGLPEEAVQREIEEKIAELTHMETTSRGMECQTEL